MIEIQKKTLELLAEIVKTQSCEVTVKTPEFTLRMGGDLLMHVTLHPKEKNYCLIKMVGAEEQRAKDFAARHRAALERFAGSAE